MSPAWRTILAMMTGLAIHAQTGAAELGHITLYGNSVLDKSAILRELNI